MSTEPKRGRPKKEVPYKLSPPCIFEVSEKQFDAVRMSGYRWNTSGVFWIGNVKMLVIEVK
jgi:hypothetical protein